MFKKFKNLVWELYKPMPLDNYFRNYDQYWDNRGFHAPALQRAKIVSNFIESDTRILDIGCGDGTIIKYLYKNNKIKKAIGIDISQKAVDHVNKQGYEAYRIDVLSEDFTKFIKKNKFDYIIVTELLEHIEDPEKVIIDLQSADCKSIFVSIPNAGLFSHRIRLLLGYFPVVTIQQHVKSLFKISDLS